MVDIQYQLKHLKDPSFTVPMDPLANASKTKMRVWEKEVDEYVMRKIKYEQNKVALYAVIWAQYSPIMKD